MSGQDVIDGQTVIDRIGAAIDRIGRAGWPSIHGALAGYTRERRGRLRAVTGPGRGGDIARDLMNLADDAERLADTLDQAARVGVDVLRLDLSADEARWLRSVVGRVADRYDDSDAPTIARRIDALLYPSDYAPADV